MLPKLYRTQPLMACGPGFCREQQGFSAIELFTAIAILAIASAVAFPGFQKAFRGNYAATASNELLNATQIARNEAVTRGLRVSICARSALNSNTCSTATGTVSWKNGWLVFTDCNGTAGVINAVSGTCTSADTILKVFPELKGNNATLNAGQSYFSYIPSGFMCTPNTSPACAGAATSITYSLVMPSCSGCGRNICVNQQGRPFIKRDPVSTTDCS